MVTASLQRLARLGLLLTIGLCASHASTAVLDSYNFVWDTPSANAAESMPCGGGDIGLNVWVEDGDLLIYLSRSGTFDENNLFPKLGRVRVRLASDPFRAKPFRQELKLRQGCVEVEAGAGERHAAIRVWVDVRRPVVHVVVDSASATTLEAIYESWRLQDHPWTGAQEADASRAFVSAPVQAVTRPDVVAFAGNAVAWCHRNRDETLFDLTVAQQGLAAVKEQMWNPLRGLTFGGTMYGQGLVAAGNSNGRYASTESRAWRVRSENAGTHHELSVALHVATTATTEAWRDGLEAIVRDATAASASAEAETRAWWAEFWDRSFVYLQPHRPDPHSRQWQAGRNYQVFRYQLGCNVRGEYPTKFNGGLFTFDPEYVDPKCPYSPDYRKWGGGTFTAQNQRLVYWPMLKSGDYDLMPAQFRFYQRARGNAELRSRVYWDVHGASFTEQIEQFGLPVAFEYGWKRPPEAPVGVEYNNWLEYVQDTSLEFCLMALDLHQHTRADITDMVALTQSCLSFFDEYYRRAAALRGKQMFDGDGKLILYPGSAAETYKMAYNATTTVAGLLGNADKLKAKYGIGLEDIKVPDFLPDTPGVRRNRANMLYEVCRLDEFLGRMLKTLESRGELENTLTILSSASDNGTWEPRSKANIYDWGLRMPLAMMWPTRVKAGRVVDETKGRLSPSGPKAIIPQPVKTRHTPNLSSRNGATAGFRVNWYNGVQLSTKPIQPNLNQTS